MCWGNIWHFISFPTFIQALVLFRRNPCCHQFKMRMHFILNLNSFYWCWKISSNGVDYLLEQPWQMKEEFWKKKKQELIKKIQKNTRNLRRRPSCLIEETHKELVVFFQVICLDLFWTFCRSSFSIHGSEAKRCSCFFLMFYCALKNYCGVLGSHKGLIKLPVEFWNLSHG